MKKYYLYILISILLLTPSLNATEKISLQLKWKHGFQFAGYYAAKEKGFYKEEGLEVELFERDLSSKKHYIDLVAQGDRDYGVADTSLILDYEKGKPVVLLSQIFQKSPSVLLTLKDSNIISPYDLKNKKVSFNHDSVGDAPIYLMFKKLYNELDFQNTPIGNDYSKLINKEVDAITAYISDQPFWFKERGIGVNIINPNDYGVDFYGDNLFTSKEELEKNPERVKKMIRATLKGWRYALSHKEEMIDIILEKYSKKKSREHLLYEGKMTELLILPKLIELGKIDRKKLHTIYNHYKDVAFAKSTKDIDNLVYSLKSSSGGYSNEEESYLESKKVLKVAALKTFPPFSYLEDDKLKGFSIDYVNTLTEKIGIKTEFVVAPWPKLLQMIKSEEIDFIPYIAKNKEREAFIDFTNFKSLVYSLGLATKSGSDIEGIKSLFGKKLAVIRKTFFHTYIEKNFPEITLVFTKSTEDAIKLVSRGKVDAFIGSIPSINFYMQKNWISNVEVMDIKDLGMSTQTDLYMGVSKGNSTLKSILEKAHKKLDYAEETRLKKRWMEQKPNEIISFLNHDEVRYLKIIKEIKICVDPNWKPYSYIGNDNKFSGITADYFKLFSQKLDTAFTLVPTKTFQESIQKLESSKCDIIPSHVLTPATKKQFLHTQAYLTSPRVYVVRGESEFIRDFREIANKKIGVLKEGGAKEVLKKLYSNAENIVEFTKLSDGLQGVSSGEIDTFVGFLGTVSHSIQKEGFQDIKIGGKLPSDVELGVLVNKEHELLVTIFNKMIETLNEEDRTNIYKKWTSVKYEKGVDYTILWQVLALASIIILLILYRNRSIELLNIQLIKANKEIDSKRHELSAQQKMVDKYILITTTDLNGIITYANEAFCRVSGFSQEELIGNKHNILKHRDMPDNVYKKLWNSISAGQSWQGELKNSKKDGSTLWVTVYIEAIYNSDKEKIGYRAIREDITDKKKIEELSIRDKLTGLYNRLKIDEILLDEIEKFHTQSVPFSVILLDLDDFKSVNDTYGHDIGDYVLKEISNVVKSSVREKDFVGRWGGEEFVVVCSQTSLEATKIVAETIRRKIQEKSFKRVGRKTASIGVTEFNETDTFISVFKRVDEALYKAKHNGKNRVEVL